MTRRRESKPVTGQHVEAALAVGVAAWLGALSIGIKILEALASSRRQP